MNTKTLLIVEDDKSLAKTMSRFFQVRDYEVISKYDGKSALRFITKFHKNIDQVILDINLPELSGLEVCHLVRNMDIELPIIMLTSRRQTDTVVTSFDLGADDYVKKPFDILELEARIDSLQKRKISQVPQKMEFLDFMIDLKQRKVYRSEKEITLRRKEFDLFLFLARNPNTALERNTILANVWKFDYEPYLSTIDAHISYLRQKIGDKDQKIIETVHGVGYRLNIN